MQQIGNINIINIENLFNDDEQEMNKIIRCKLSYMNYCAVT
jgi:hypothetical protein